MLLMILVVKKMLERFMKNNCNNQIKQSLELNNSSREKTVNYMPNGRATINLLTVELIKKILFYKMS